MSEAPTFVIGMVTVTKTGRFQVEVSRQGDGLRHLFRGHSPDEAKARASAWINGELSKFYKSLAAKHARAQGRTLQSLKASSGAESA